MITEKELDKHQFVSYYSPKAYGEYCKRLWQKTIRCPKTNLKLYFVNIYLYVFPIDTGSQNMWSCKCRMYTKKDSFDLNLMSDSGTTVEYVLNFYSDAYDKLNCVPDVHNNDN